VSHQDNIQCPYCDYIHEEWWEIINEGDENFDHECSNCEKKFVINVSRSVSFENKKPICTDIGKKCVYTEPKRSDLSQETCDRWNKDGDGFIWKPKFHWRMDCIECEDLEVDEVKEGDPCPERLKAIYQDSLEP
jgi:uncharacterized Zn-finger protein